MSNFYTNVFLNKGKIYTRGIKNGIPFKHSFKYKPYLFVQAKNGENEYHTTDGRAVAKIDFDSVWDAKEFVKQYESVDGFNIYGLTNYQYQYLFEEYPTQLEYDSSLISVVGLDIENKMGSTDIATSIATTPNEITAITISRNGGKDVFGCGDYIEHEDNITYHKCRDEEHLLRTFIRVWNSDKYSPDVVTGWNIEFYDIPYLVGRIVKLLGRDAAAELSPWGIITPYEIEIKGKSVTSYNIAGISCLDYLALYKKFVLQPRETYRLDFIAEVELDEKKVDYKSEGYTSLDDLYAKNFQRFIEYNIHDVTLVDRIDDKLKLIDLVFAMAYEAKINYNDTLGVVTQWDIIIHNYLMERKTVIPLSKPGFFTDFAGGYVKEPKPGRYKWVVSCDLNSLYPHLIQQYNISPEMFVKRLSNFPTIEQILAGAEVPDIGYSIAANGCCYSKERQGFLSALMEKMYKDRQHFKKLMLEAEQNYEDTKDPKFKKEAARLNALQHAKKINLNSAYGALGNRFFRWFDINHAEAITLSGQLSIQWIAIKINAYLNKACGTKGIDYIIASDTDSIYINLERVVDMKFTDQSDKKKIVDFLDRLCKNVIEPFIEKSYQELADHMHSYSQKMNMKREAIADVAIWVAAKNYIMNVWNNEGVAYEKPKLKMTGIAAIKSSTPKACREALKKAIELTVNADEHTVQSYVKQFKEEFSKLNFEDIAFPRGITNVDQYISTNDQLYVKGTPVHVKGSILYNKLIDKFKLNGQYENIGNGDKIRFCYLSNPNPYGVNVISCANELPEQFDLNKYLDYDLQFTKAFIDPLTIILRAIGWQAEKKASIESFFE